MALSTPYSDNLGIGTVTFTMNGSAVTTAGVNKLLVMGDGIYIDDVILEVGTSVAAGTGTLLQILKTDTTGTPLVLSHAISALTANTTFDLSTATTKNRSFCAGGTYINVGSTGANGSAGDFRVSIKYRRMNSNSGLQAV
jgi:hypothetical protein